MSQGSGIQIFIEPLIKMVSFVLSNVFAVLDKIQYCSGMSFRPCVQLKLILK
jgi:hypothetical protein